MTAPTYTAESLLAESYGDYVDPREMLWDDARFFYGAETPSPSVSFVTPFTTVNDRLGGQFLPFYRNETDLAFIRGLARRMRSLNAVTIGAIEALGSYVLGPTGFAFRVSPAKGLEDECPRELVVALQKLIDRFIDRNDIAGELDREIHGGSREDGESFVVLTKDSSGVLTEILEPDQITEPANPTHLYDWIRDEFSIDCDGFVPCWRFGILTPEHRTWQPLAYHIVRDNAGHDWDLIPSGRMVHFKRNVTRNAKRGVSDLFPILEDCSNEVKLARNTVTGAALQASIPWIEEMPPGTTQATTDALGTAQADIQRQRPKAVGTETLNFRRYRPGTIVRTSPGRLFKPGPMGTERADNFIEVAAFILRRIGIRWNFPEYLISGDASNANYASTLVSESPFVKARESDQQWYGRRFHAMLWKMLRLEYQAGTFERFGLTWDQIETLADIAVDAPAVATRNPLEMAQRHAIQIKTGVMSIETAQIEAGLDPALEKKRGAQVEAIPAGSGIEPADKGALSGLLSEAFDGAKDLDEARRRTLESLGLGG